MYIHHFRKIYFRNVEIELKMYFRPFRLLKVLSIILCISVSLYQVYRLLSYSMKKPLTIGKPSIIEKPLTTEKSLTIEKQSISPTSLLKLDKDFEEISETLEPFYIRLPNFSDDEAKDWFYNCTYYKINSKKCSESSCKNGIIFNDPKEHLSVKIAFVKNGLYLNDDCGYNYGDVAVKRTFTNENEATDIYDKVFIYTVPDGWSFQHFLDGIGPKLSHSYSYLNKYPDAKILIIRGARFDRSVKEIWSMLG
jgi:hypothetical protein